MTCDHRSATWSSKDSVQKLWVKHFCEWPDGEQTMFYDFLAPLSEVEVERKESGMSDKQAIVKTNRIEKWQLNEVFCVLCGDEIGWAVGVPSVWCYRCAKQEEDAEDL